MECHVIATDVLPALSRVFNNKVYVNNNLLGFLQDPKHIFYYELHETRPTDPSIWS